IRPSRWSQASRIRSFTLPAPRSWFTKAWTTTRATLPGMPAPASPAALSPALAVVTHRRVEFSNFIAASAPNSRVKANAEKVIVGLRLTKPSARRGRATRHAIGGARRCRPTQSSYRNRGPFRRVALRGTIQRWISLRVTLGAPRATDRAFHAVPPKDIREMLSRSLVLLCVSAPRGPQAPSRLVEHLHFHVLSCVPPSPSLCWVRAWSGSILKDDASRKTARLPAPPTRALPLTGDNPCVSRCTSARVISSMRLHTKVQGCARVLALLFKSRARLEAEIPTPSKEKAPLQRGQISPLQIRFWNCGSCRFPSVWKDNSGAQGS